MKNIAKEFYEDAIRYYKAALIIVNNVEEKLNNDQRMLAPILYLLRHSIELSLKALIFKVVKQLNTRNKLEKLKTIGCNEIGKEKLILKCHSLKDLNKTLNYYSQILINIVFSDEELEFVNNLIDKYDKIDRQSDYFRYPMAYPNNKHKRNFLAISEYNVASDLVNIQDIYLLEGSNIHTLYDKEGFLELALEMKKLVKLLLSKY